MLLSGIAKPYAVALFNAAIKEEIADQIDGDIASFASLVAKNDAFRQYLGSPEILTDQKKDLVLKVIGERTSGLFVKFVMLLIDKKRIQFIGEMSRAYNQLFEQHRGIVEVRAITAIEMDHDLQTLTRQTIEKKTGKKVRLIPQKDPRIIGGMILIIDNNIIDGSIRFQLDTIGKSLGEVKVH